MLSAIDLKPHLLHSDRLVRDAVFEYFAESWSRDPDLVPGALEAVRRFGPRETRIPLTACERLLLTDRSLDGVLTTLASIEDDLAAARLNTLVARAPVGVQIQNEGRILETPNLRPEVAERVGRRRELSSWPAEKLWRELEDLACRSEGRYVGEIDHGLADDLIEGLAGHPEPDDARICEILASEATQGWLEIFAIDLAGARRLRAAIPHLVAKLRIDTDYMLERAVGALARIGDVDAIRLIASTFASESWNFRNYASAVLAELKSETAEAALLDLLPTERDEGIRVWLCLGLCKQFSRRGLAVVLQEIASGYDEQAASLREEVLPVAELLGVHLPHATLWREEAQRERARLADLEIDPANDSLDPLEDLFGPESSHSTGYRRPHPKIGRNALCPCGSGRKYKKCCGRT